MGRQRLQGSSEDPEDNVLKVLPDYAASAPLQEETLLSRGFDILSPGESILSKTHSAEDSPYEINKFMLV